MNLQRAALLAAIGVLLQGANYWVTNLVPSWSASGWFARFDLLVAAIIGPLAWACFFLSIRKGGGIRWAALIAAAVSIIELALIVQRQYLTFSALSFDTIGFIMGTLLPAFCWLLLLLRFAGFAVSFRSASVYLILVCLVQFGLVFYEFIDSAGQIRAFWSIEPQAVLKRLIATPMIWMFYWITQALFLRWAQKA